MILPLIHEITILGVADAGVPNSERVVLRPTETINLASIGLYVGVQLPTGLIQPVPDQFFWFGELVVAPPSWLFVFTGRGAYTESKMPDSGHPAHIVHWNKPYTLFNQPTQVPVLFRYDGISVGSSHLAGQRKG